MKHRHLPAAALVTLALLPGAVRAQTAPDTFRLQRIVVTASKLPAPLAAVPAHVTVLSGDSLRARGYLHVVDALEGTAGIGTAQLGSAGAVTSLFMRGGESDYVQVLVDGVQVNDPGGAFDWAHLTLADVERIEIVRGPASVLYGSDAVAGVIQIFTRRGEGTPSISAEAAAGRGRRVGERAAGTFATWSAAASVSGSAAVGRSLGAAYSATAARDRSEGGYAFNNEYGNSTVSAGVRLRHERGAELGLSARYGDQRFHYPTDGAGHVLDHNRYTAGESLALGARASQPLPAGMRAHLSLSSYRNDTGAADPEDEPAQGWSRSTAANRRTAAEFRIDVPVAAGATTSLGGEYETQRGRTHFESDGPSGAYRDSSDDRRNGRALFAQLVRARGRLSFTAGARLDDSEQFGSFGTARAGAGYQLARTVRMHVSYGTGFKEPTFFETYATGFARGNPGLQPEQSRSGEAGVSIAGGVGDVAITAFAQEFRNLIQYTFTPPTPDAPNYFNIGRAVARGIEAEASVPLTGRLAASLSYTYLYTRVTDAGFGEDRQFSRGLRLLRRPDHQAAATLSWRNDVLGASLDARYLGRRDDLDFTDATEWQGRRVALKSLVTLDAVADYRLPLSTETRLTLRVQNALDRRYEEVYNFPAAGRLVELGIHLTQPLSPARQASGSAYRLQ